MFNFGEDLFFAYFFKIKIILKEYFNEFEVYIHTTLSIFSTYKPRIYLEYYSLSKYDFLLNHVNQGCISAEISICELLLMISSNSNVLDFCTRRFT